LQRDEDKFPVHRGIGNDIVERVGESVDIGRCQGDASDHRCLADGGRTALLSNVRELVGDQVTPAFRMRRVLAATENDIASERVGTCVDRTRGLRAGIAGMDSDAAEILPETQFKKMSRLKIERLATRRRDAPEARLAWSAS